MDRRTFLTIMGGASLAALAAGCQSVPTDSLKIALLEGSIPPQLIQAFKRQLGEGEEVSIIPADSLLKLFKLLQGWQQPAQNQEAATNTSRPIANWLSLGDYWLQPAIQQELVQTGGRQQPGVLARSLPAIWKGAIEPRTARVALANLPATPLGSALPLGAIWPFFTIPLRRLKSDPITQWEDLLRPEGGAAGWCCLTIRGW